MTINVTTNDITNTTSASSAGIINANFAAIKAGLLKALNQEAGASNTMATDIDMDGNDLLNVTSLNGVSVASLLTVVSNVDAAAVSAAAAAASASAASTDASAASSSAASAATEASNAATSATAAAASAASIDDSVNVVDVNGSRTAVLTDKKDMFRFHTSTGTLNLTAAATLTDGWWCYVKAEGVAVTVDPDASEQIDSAGTLALEAGQSAIIICDGTEFHSILIGAGSGGLTFTEVTSGPHNISAGEGVLANTAGGAFTVNLPASPSVGDALAIADPNGNWSTNNVTIGRNSENIQGLAEDLTGNTNRIRLDFLYFSGGWVVYSSMNTSGGVPLFASDNLSGLSDRAASRDNLNRWVDKTAAYDLQVGDWINVDSSGGSFTLTLPATASDGAEIRIRDKNTSWATNNVTVARNGNTIDGNADDMNLSTSNVEHVFIYDNSASDWEVNSHTASTGSAGFAKRVLLETITASSDSTIEFTTGIDSTYKKYVIECINVKPGTDDQQMRLRLSDDAGVSWYNGASDYDFAHMYIQSASVHNHYVTTNTDNIPVGSFNLGNNTGEHFHSTIELFEPSNTNSFKTVLIRQTGTNTDQRSCWSDGTGDLKVSGAESVAINGVQLYMASGDVASGTFKLYGEE